MVRGWIQRNVERGKTYRTIVVCMAPCIFVLASGDVIVSYATATSPPAVPTGTSILDTLRVVGADDTVATVDLLVESDIGYSDTVEFLEPLLDFGRVDRWGDSPVGGPLGSSQADWKNAE